MDTSKDVHMNFGDNQSSIRTVMWTGWVEKNKTSQAPTWGGPISDQSHPPKAFKSLQILLEEGVNFRADIIFTYRPII